MSLLVFHHPKSNQQSTCQLVNSSTGEQFCCFFVEPFTLWSWSHFWSMFVGMFVMFVHFADWYPRVWAQHQSSGMCVSWSPVVHCKYHLQHRDEKSRRHLDGFLGPLLAPQGMALVSLWREPCTGLCAASGGWVRLRWWGGEWHELMDVMDVTLW